MTKKFTTLLLLMLGFVATAMAQTFQVAATPTELSNIKSGYYVIKVKSADGKSDENGNYLYVQDNKPYYDAKGSENSFAGSTIGDDAHKYIFFVDNTDGKLTFQAYGTEVHFPSISSASYSKQKPGNQDQFTLNSTTSQFTPKEVSTSWYYMQTRAQENNGDWRVWKNENYDVTITIILNDNQHVGYWNNTDNATNNAQFQFYKAVGAANITYNFMWNGESKSKQSFNLVVGDHFPMPTFPKYTTTTSELPSADATITNADDGREIVVNCTAELPFTLSTAEAPVYYYLTTATEAPIMLYRDGQDIKYRTAEQNTTLNNVLNDLWYLQAIPSMVTNSAVQQVMQRHRATRSFRRTDHCSSIVVNSPFGARMWVQATLAVQTPRPGISRRMTTTPSKSTPTDSPWIIAGALMVHTFVSIQQAIV